MPGIGAAGYLAAFVAPLVLAWVLTPLALRAALRFRAVDEPGERKVQQQAVPYLGGVAIVAAFSLTVLAAAGLRAGTDLPARVPQIIRPAWPGEVEVGKCGRWS